VAKDEIDAARQRRAGQQRQPGRTRWIVHLLLMIIASAIVVDALIGDRGLVAMLRARHEYDQLSASIAQQRAENARLRETARRLREDPAAIEEIARRELGLIRPGERVFIVKDAQKIKN
jgi:cell division protein FtsB